MNSATTPAEYSNDHRPSARRLLLKISAALLFSLMMVVIGSLL